MSDLNKIVSDIALGLWVYDTEAPNYEMICGSKSSEMFNFLTRAMRNFQ